MFFYFYVYLSGLCLITSSACIILKTSPNSEFSPVPMTMPYNLKAKWLKMCANIIRLIPQKINRNVWIRISYNYFLIMGGWINEITK